MLTKRNTVLFVAGNDPAAGKVVSFLQSMHFDVVRCDRALDAVQLAYEIRPDAVLIRQDLPEMPGCNICEMLRASSGHVRAPMLLIATDRQVARTGMEGCVSACDYVLRAPFNPMDLYNLLVTAIRAAGEGKLGRATASHRPELAEEKQTRRPDQAVSSRSGGSSADAAPIELTGQLTRIPIPRLLHWMLKGRMSGLLSLSHTGQRIDVHIGDGYPRRLRSNYIRELALGTILVDRGRISESDRRHIWEEARVAGVRFGAKLVDYGIIGPGEIDALIRLQSREKLILVFDDSWRAGDYRFHSANPQSEEMYPLEADPGELIVEGIRRRYSPERVASFFNRNNRMRATLSKSTRHLYDAARLGLSNWEAQILSSIRSGHTPTDVVAASGGDRTKALNFLYALVVMDILKVQSRSTAPAPGAPVKH